MMSCSIIRSQCTALHLAAMWGHTDSVSLLVAKGANVNMVDKVKVYCNILLVSTRVMDY